MVSYIYVLIGDGFQKRDLQYIDNWHSALDVRLTLNKVNLCGSLSDLGLGFFW